MDLKGTFLVIVLVVSSVIAEEEPNRHRMDINRLLVDTKDAVRMHKLRKDLVSERQALKKERLRQKMDEEAMNADVAKEKEAAREARAAVDEIHEALFEAKRALKSLQNAAHVANRQAAPARNNSEEPIDVDDNNDDILKVVKVAHSSEQKTKNGEIVISKGMTKNEEKINGETDQKIVKESEDKKNDGEITIDKQSSMVIDKNPAAGDPNDPVAMELAGENAAAGLTYQIINFVAMAAFTFVLVF